MSISISVVAQKQLSKDDFEKIALYNSLTEKDYVVPKQLKIDIGTILGEHIYMGELVQVPNGRQVVEVGLDGKGDVMYGNGLVIPLSAIPLNTVAIRIYAS